MLILLCPPRGPALIHFILFHTPHKNTVLGQCMAESITRRRRLSPKHSIEVGTLEYWYSPTPLPLFLPRCLAKGLPLVGTQRSPSRQNFRSSIASPQILSPSEVAPLSSMDPSFPAPSLLPSALVYLPLLFFISTFPTCSPSQTVLLGPSAAASSSTTMPSWGPLINSLSGAL